MVILYRLQILRNLCLFSLFLFHVVSTPLHLMKSVAFSTKCLKLKNKSNKMYK